MPLKWEPNFNPYVHSYFGRLRLGPNASPVQMITQAQQLVQKLKAGEEIALGEQKLDEHALNEAHTKLREPEALAQELLLTHSQPKGGNKKTKSLCEELRQAAVLPETCAPIPLIHPLAIFWFIPKPGRDAVPLPDWSSFGLVEAGDEPDLKLDIVFDG